MKHRKNKDLKLFLGFSEVANYYTNLTHGLSEIDIEYTFLSWGQNIRNYDIDSKKTLEQSIIHFISKNISGNFFKQNMFRALFMFLRVFLLIKYIVRCNTFIFSYNASFLKGIDLPLLKFLGKRVIYIYHGSDSRPSYLSGNYVGYNLNTKIIKKINNDLFKRVRWREKYADEIVCLPASAQLFNRKLINFLWLGLPFRSFEHEHNFNLTGPLRIVHAPSAKKPKGTAIFRQIISSLQEEGYDIEYSELDGVDNSVVLEKLKNTDLLLDELYSDTRLAGLGVEAAAFKVPSIVGGYHNDIGRYSLSDWLAPCFYTEPDNVKSLIKNLYNDRSRIEKVGSEANIFVKTYYEPKFVAKRLVNIINGSVPKEAYFSKEATNNFAGWGCSRQELLEDLRRFINDHGICSLKLGHNPNLKNSIAEFVQDKVE